MTTPPAPARPATLPTSGLLALGAVWLVPLAVMPGLDQPFSAPKLWVLTAAALLLVPATLGRRWRAGGQAPGGWAPSAGLLGLCGLWLTSFIVSAAVGPLPGLPDTLLGVVAPAFALAVLASGADARQVVAAQVGAATVVAVTALAQWCGVDPWLLLGWEAPVDGLSVRMRVYATLGNPNFVGALMALTVPLAVALTVTSRSRRWRSAVLVPSLVCLLGALLATGSRGAVLGLSAGSLVWALLRGSRRAVAAVCVVVVVGVLAIWHSPARPLQTTIDGRWYLWQVVAPHAAEHPLAGSGPGAVALRFAAWQREADARGVSDVRFRGLADHVHNDYLEALVERGVIGVGALLAPLLVVAVTGWRQRRGPPLLAGAVAAVAAGAACALVDFPLARPAELVWWWTAVGLVHVYGRAASPPGAARSGQSGEQHVANVSGDR